MTDTAIAPAPDVPNGPWAQSLRLGFRFLFALVLLGALAWPFSNLHQVQPENRAVVLRLGRVIRIAGPGLLLAWPRPIEEVVLLPAAERQIEFAFDPLAPPPDAGTTDFTMSDDPRQDAGFVLTADGVVHVTATLFYRIVDPTAYMQQAAHVRPALIRLTMASLVALAASRDTDAMVVTQSGADPTQQDEGKRERLRSDLIAAINRRLADLAQQDAGIGVEVGRVDIGVALPNGAKAAFDGVLVATQEADTAVADARSYAAETDQKSQQDRNTLLADANAAAEERRSAASAQTATITALAAIPDGIGKAANFTRIYTDRMTALLHHAGSVYAVDSNSDVRPILPGERP